jgi:hypothetical protein
MITWVNGEENRSVQERRGHLTLACDAGLDWRKCRLATAVAPNLRAGRTHVRMRTKTNPGTALETGTERTDDAALARIWHDQQQLRQKHPLSRAFKSGPGRYPTSDLPRVRWLGAEAISFAAQSVATRSTWTPQSTCSESLAPFWPYRLGAADITTHSFRKSLATLIDDEGLSARIGAGHMGHTNVSMTQDKYMSRGRVHTQVAELLDRFFSESDGQTHGPPRLARLLDEYALRTLRGYDLHT